MQKRLLSEADLTFAKALELAQSMKLANKNSKALKGTELAVRKLSHAPHQGAHQTSSPSNPCYRCGRTNHDVTTCCFATVTCHHCGKKGHIATVCKSKKQNSQSRTGSRRPPHRARWVDVGGADTNEVPRMHAHKQREQEDLQLYTVGKKSSRPIVVEPQVNGRALPMEIDTGAAVSLKRVQTQEYPSAMLRPNDVTLRTYTDKRMDVLGEMLVEVVYENQRKTLPLRVVAGAGPSLFGRNWLEHLTINWRQVLSVTCMPTIQTQLQALLKKCHQVFTDELGTIRDLEASLQVHPDAQPKFLQSPDRPLCPSTSCRAGTGTSRSQWHNWGERERAQYF